VATFVPVQADFPVVLLSKIAFAVRKILIDRHRPNDLRIRNAWVRGSNALCAPIFTGLFGHIGAGDLLARWFHCGRFCAPKSSITPTSSSRRKITHKPARERCTEPEVLDQRIEILVAVE
jgi:hypothetical protein